MKYDSELFDLPVVDRISGELVGYMRGVVCQPGKKKMEGIVYEERGWMRRCHFMPWQAISVIGDKSIVIDSSKRNRASRNVACPGRDSKVYDSDGNYVGRISNYLIDEKKRFGTGDGAFRQHDGRPKIWQENYRKQGQHNKRRRFPHAGQQR